MVEKINSAAEYDSTLKNNKSVFVDFYADWCGPCKMVSPIVEQISESYKDVKFIKVNVDEFPDIASRYGIMSIPTLIAFQNGKLVTQAIGFQREDTLKTMVEKIR